MYANIKYDIEKLKGVPPDSSLAEFARPANGPKPDTWSYSAMRLFTNKTDPAAAPMTASHLSTGWFFYTPGWARRLAGMHNASDMPRVPKVGDRFGAYEVIRKNPSSIVARKQTPDIDMYLSVDLVKAMHSDTRDKYYASCGTCATAKTSTGRFFINYIFPLQTPLLNILLKRGAQSAQDIYMGRDAASRMQLETLRNAVYQKTDVKSYHKGDRKDMGQAEASAR